MLSTAFFALCILNALVLSQTLVDPGVPVIGPDFQLTLEINIWGLNESLAIMYWHAGSLGFTRLEFQSGETKTYVHIANSSNDSILLLSNANSSWSCAQYHYMSPLGFGEAGTTPGAYLDDNGWVATLFRGTTQTFNSLFEVGAPLVESYQGQVNVRGVLCDSWTAQFTQMMGQSGLVTRTAYFSASSVDFNELEGTRVPIQIVINGTLNNAPVYWVYNFVNFLPFNPPVWRQSELFGDCFAQRNVAVVGVGDDDDDHHDDVKIPPLPALSTNYSFTMEVNMFSHNSSFFISFWLLGNKCRIEYESNGTRWTDIADGDAGMRYEFQTATPTACTAVPLMSNMTFGGEPSQSYPPYFVPWNGVEDDDDDLIEALFYRIGIMHQTLYQLFFANNNPSNYKGQVNVRGVRCNQWGTQITSLPWWPNTPCNLSADVFITTPGVEFNGYFFFPAPMRFSLNGTIQGVPYNHVYEIVDYMPLTATAGQAVQTFGSCTSQVAIANMLSAIAVAQNSMNPIPPIGVLTPAPVSSVTTSQPNIAGIAVLCVVVGLAVGLAAGIGGCWLKQRRSVQVV